MTTTPPVGLSPENKALVDRHVSVIGGSMSNMAFVVAEDDMERLLNAAREQGPPVSAPAPEVGSLIEKLNDLLRQATTLGRVPAIIGGQGIVRERTS